MEKAKKLLGTIVFIVFILFFLSIVPVVSGLLLQAFWNNVIVAAFTFAVPLDFFISLVVATVLVAYFTVRFVLAVVLAIWNAC